ncbi:tyrosine-type recombinase/integrase [Paractinoplanes lichenicola]|uniref:Tyrosine-type recombinase/integrase n=1 Tax=Paractinoplanes lichenicola TaxID=2802976 RepID=A0ABS1W1R2_9ACTN|nr:tyrosine-type recombinase/integrase [Actinoplanes lichenicola]
MTRPDGIPLRPDRVTVEFERHVAACGLPSCPLHDTRHGACSLMLAGGVPIEIVQMILGHSTPEVTRRVYAHLMRSETAAQVEEAAKLLTHHRPA